MRFLKGEVVDADADAAATRRATTMEEIFPLTAASTLSLRAEESGAYPSPVTALAFDPTEELLWTGTQDGRMTVLHSPSLERYGGVQAHPHDHEVLDVVPTGGIGGGAVSVSATHVSFHSSGCVKRWGHPEGVADPENDPLTCAAVDPHAMGGGGRAYVGRTSPQMIQIDIGSGRVSLRAELTPASCSAGTAVMARPARPSTPHHTTRLLNINKRSTHLFKVYSMG